MSFRVAAPRPGEPVAVSTLAAAYVSVVDEANVAAAASLEILLVTGDEVPRMFFDGSASGDITLSIFEATTVSANGASRLVTNVNRLNPVAASSTVFEAPTITTDGTLLVEATIFGGTGGEKKNAGSVFTTPVPWLLLPNTIYLGRLTNITAQVQRLQVTLSWTEGAISEANALRSL